MCGFFFSYNCNLNPNETWLELRGPDDRNELIQGKDRFIHFHLKTTENSHNGIQPFKTKHGVLMFNGTVYPDKETEYDYWFASLDDNVTRIHEAIRSVPGEFALVYVTDQTITIACDTFGTKPLWIAELADGLIVSSLRSAIPHNHLYRMQPNHIMTYDKNTMQIIKDSTLIDFDLTQKTQSYDRVHETFEQVMNDMITLTGKTSVAISSGMDSGVIQCFIEQNNPINQCVVYPSSENIAILSERQVMSNSHWSWIQPDGKKYTSVMHLWDLKADQPYHNHYERGEPEMHLIFKQMQKKGSVIALSGVGGDEIYSDYGWNGERYRSHSNFGGVWPANFSLIWPYHIMNQWLDYGLQLTDPIGGMYGIESRFPLIDRRLVQAWINTEQKLKNTKYKGWMQDYMDQYKYPYTLKKYGFRIVPE